MVDFAGIKSFFTPKANPITEPSIAEAPSKPAASGAPKYSAPGDGFSMGDSNPGRDFAKFSGGSSNSVRASDDSFGGKGIDGDAAEKAVKARGNPKIPLEGKSEGERTELAKNLTQVDGNAETTKDQADCATHSAVVATYVKNPAELKKVAAGLGKEPNLDVIADKAGMDVGDAQKALKAVESGNPTAKDISIMSSLLHQKVRMDPKYKERMGADASQPGMNHDGLGFVRDQMKAYGANVPPMTFQQTKTPGDNAAHWTVAVPAEGGGQVAFDGWPDSKGKARVGKVGDGDQAVKDFVTQDGSTAGMTSRPM